MSRRAGRQRKRDDSNDDSNAGLSTAGKVALGVAAAAAGAAIGYLGSRLMSTWLAAETDDEKETKCKASGDDDSKYNESRPAASKDDLTTDRKAPQSTASDVTSSKQADTVQLSLHEQLSHYYQQYVVIPLDKIHGVQKVVDDVTAVVRSRLRDPNSFKGVPLKIGDLVSFGSATEGLQVIRPDCYDVMIPVMLGSQCHTREAVVAGRKVAGRFVIVADNDGTCDERNACCDEDGRLVRGKLVDVLRVVIEMATSALPDHDCVIQPASHAATAITLTVNINSYDRVSVNFVPFIIASSHLYLPVASPSWCSGETDNIASLWMESYIRQEKWSIDRFDPSVCGHLIVLRILKSIRLNHREQFGAVSSYHLKLLLFHVLEDLPDSADWQRNAVGERLIDLLTKLVEVLHEHGMPHYFEQDVNTLEDVPTETCQNLAKFLEKKLAHNDIVSLLKRDY